MQKLDSITVRHGDEERYIELYEGDLTAMYEEVDVLIVSAFPDHYEPTPGTLVASLENRGVSLSMLASDKAVDLRQAFSCWMSNDISSDDAGIKFKRILCFEPYTRGHPTEVVGDIFQSLMPFVHGNPPITSIAMPLVATGNQNVPLVDMLEPLLDAAAHWLALGLPVKTLKIVEIDPLKAAELKGAFAVLKRAYTGSVIKKKHQFKYDVFISYSHDDTQEVKTLTDELKKLRPDLNIFLDSSELKTGMAWQQELYENLDDCRKVIAVYSPTYLTSKVCKEEFNIAVFRHRDSEDGVLLPIYLYDSDLPTYMKLIQFTDCREGDMNLIRKACKGLLSSL